MKRVGKATFLTIGAISVMAVYAVVLIGEINAQQLADAEQPSQNFDDLHVRSK